jgi:asparagine synthase (glutamine-hydrolysing)
VRARLKEAVRKRLVSDVPLGAFLSGGIDSSAVVAMMREIGAGHILTCSIGFDEPRYDESSYARMVAEAKHTDHKAEIVATSDYSLVDRLVGIYDEPYADSSAIPTYRVCELARRHVTVALSGDGGDENLIGYRRYKLFAMEEQVRSRVPLGLRKAIFGPLGSLYPKLDWAPRVLRGKTTFQALARDAVAAYFHGVSICSNEMRAALFSHEFRRELQGYGAEEVFRQHVRGKTFNDPLKMIQYLDFKTYLPGDILTKVDRASMAVSLEARVPLLDHRVIEYSWTLPYTFKWRDSQSKWALRRVLDRYVPQNLIDRPKTGFGVPFADWLRGPLREWAENLLSESRLERDQLLDPAPIRAQWAEHLKGTNWGYPLWDVLMLNAWLEANPGVLAT